MGHQKSIGLAHHILFQTALQRPGSGDCGLYLLRFAEAVLGGPVQLTDTLPRAFRLMLAARFASKLSVGGSEYI